MPAAPPPRLSRLSRLGLGVQRALDRRLTPLGVWVMRRTKGGVAGAWKVDALLLRTRGRRSGRERTVVLMYLPDGEAMVVTASNDGGASHPGWYSNLQADPSAMVEVAGRVLRVRAEELSADEATLWWQRIVQRSPGYARYRRATCRPFPVVRLIPVTEPAVETGSATASSPAASERPLPPGS